MDEIKYTPIGTIHSPFKDISDMPIQPSRAKGTKGTVEIEPKYLRGLKDIDGFSHIILIYQFHLSKGYSLEVIPFLDEYPRGVFSTRAPKRPNPIGLSIVKLVKVENNIIHIENVDIVDNTPLLDIKPYVTKFDAPEEVKIGWLARIKDEVKKKKSDYRFE